MDFNLRNVVGSLLGRGTVSTTDRRPPRPLILRADDWGYAAGQALDAMAADDAAAWTELLTFMRTVRGSRPTARWLAEARERIRAFGDDRFKETAIGWLALLDRPASSRDDAQERQPVSYARADELRRLANERRAALDHNTDILQGLVWSCGSLDHDDALVRALGDAALASLKKIPEIGARARRVGNACIWALGNDASVGAIGQLQRLRARVTYAQTRTLIDAALDGAATRSGMTRDDLDELAVPTFGLDAGRLGVSFGSASAELIAEGVHQVSLRWYGAGGTPRKGEPAEVKRGWPAELKTLKQTVRDVRDALPVQRDRIERLLLSERSWALRDWRERFLDHPLLSVLARRLIWQFQAGERTGAGAWLDGNLVDADDRPLDWLADDARVRLWHPIGCEPTTVLAWRDWLDRHAVTQPFKQAYREIYVITDAELRTDTYSNRFAAHIIRQHQFQALCRQRGWSYDLQGAFDSHNVPTLVLPRWDLAVEFWVESAEGDDGSLSDAGMYLYVTTDQVRFASLGSRERLRLTDVPALVFTEMMRDVDLFVGVCSIGNDPTWVDGAPRGYDEYWQGFAFGDLSASAQTRRAVLERLLPRLAIASRCTLLDRFLVVRGDLRTYKIHLGSGNILMEPNDQYLCIVPDRSQRAEDGAGRLFLPFEGDSTLALILSKAMLLADDRKISDPTITRQIAMR